MHAEWKGSREKNGRKSGVCNKDILNESAVLVVLLHRQGFQRKGSILRITSRHHHYVIEVNSALGVEHLHHLMNLIQIQSRIDGDRLVPALLLRAPKLARKVSQNVDDIDLEHGQRQIARIHHYP